MDLVILVPGAKLHWIGIYREEQRRAGLDVESRVGYGVIMGERVGKERLEGQPPQGSGKLSVNLVLVRGIGVPFPCRHSVGIKVISLLVCHLPGQILVELERELNA